MMKMTVFDLPKGDAEMRCMVSTILFWAWASREEVWEAVVSDGEERWRERKYRFVKQQQVDLGSVGSHESAGKCYSLPLEPD